MKYIRKAIAVILAAVFIAAVAIGFSVIFAVKNINITVCYIEESAQSVDYSEMVSDVKEQLESLKGKSILSINEDDFTSLSQSSGYARFVSYKKVYPCTVNITIEERQETFTCITQNADGSTAYDIYDEYGSYITTKADNRNNIDGCANILVTCVDTDIVDIAEIAMAFKEEYSALRSVVKSITVSGNMSGTSDYVFNLYCGTSLKLVNYTQYTSEKLTALVRVFNSLDDYSKTYGEVSCRADESGLYITLPDGTFYKV